MNFTSMYIYIKEIYVVKETIMGHAGPDMDQIGPYSKAEFCDWKRCIKNTLQLVCKYFNF